MLSTVTHCVVFEALCAACSPTCAHAITQGLWWSLLPLIVRDMNAGGGINVAALLDEAWSAALIATAQSDEADSDMLYVLEYAILMSPLEMPGSPPHTVVLL